MSIYTNKLFELQDLSYQKFALSLIPDEKNLIGVRMPVLRKFCKKILKEDSVKNFFEDPTKIYFEEIILEGFLIGSLNIPFNELTLYIDSFIPKIRNWSICDSFCSSLKITKLYKDEMFKYLYNLKSSKEEYTLRFYVVMLLTYYLEEEYLNEVLEILNTLKHDGYYFKMSVAWALSIAYIKFPNPILNFLKNSSLDDFTWNKSLQKICESTRVSHLEKEKIRTFKKNFKTT